MSPAGAYCEGPVLGRAVFLFEGAECFNAAVLANELEAVDLQIVSGLSLEMLVFCSKAWSRHNLLRNVSTQQCCQRQFGRGCADCGDLSFEGLIEADFGADFSTQSRSDDDLE